MEIKNTEELTDELKKNSFTSNKNFFNDEEIKFLVDSCNNIESTNKVKEFFKNENSSENLYVNEFSEKTFFSTIATNIIGINENLDRFFERTLNHQDIKIILTKVLGPNYKINNFVMRYADEKSKFLGWHQDDHKAFSMMILLNDVSDKSATTSFIKGSHLFNYNFSNSLEKLNPNYFKSISSRATGKKGDLIFFLNKSIHGMKVGNNSKVILICFVPEENKNTKYIFPKLTRYNIEFPVALGNELKRLFLLDENFKKNKIDNSLDAHKRIIDEEVGFIRLAFPHKLIYFFFIFMSIFMKIIKYIYRKLKFIF